MKRFYLSQCEYKWTHAYTHMEQIWVRKELGEELYHLCPDDWNFDTVFEGKLSINEKGWSMEMKIPYSALRFPTTDIQSWGIQFSRRIIEFGEFYTWNFIDTKT